MHCVKCGKQLPGGAVFCAHCGTRQPPAGATAATASAPAAKSSTSWAPIASIVGGVAILAGVGFWAWSNQAAQEEASRKAAAEADKASSLQAVAAKAPKAPTLTPEEAADRAEIVAAQAALSKHILAEEALAKAKAGAK
jgi:hypothetical protein